MDLGITSVGNGHTGAQLPSRILERNLNRNAVGGERFDHRSAIVEAVRARRAQLPANDAVLAGGVFNRAGSAGRAWWWGSGKMQASDVAMLTVCGADLDGVASCVRQDGNFLAAVKIGHEAEGKGLLCVYGDGNAPNIPADHLLTGRARDQRQARAGFCSPRRRCEGQACESACNQEFAIHSDLSPLSDESLPRLCFVSVHCHVRFTEGFGI